MTVLVDHIKETPRWDFRWLASPGLLIPIILVNAIGFAVPMVRLAVMSFLEPLPAGGVGTAYTTATWLSVFADVYYLELVWRTLWMSAVITTAALICSYPIAWLIHCSRGALRSALLVIVVMPLLTSAVVRSFGWVAILGDQGFLAPALRMLGITGAPLMYNMTGVIIGLTEIQMPYMILAILVGLGRVDPSFEEASRTLGATSLSTFWRIVFPLSMPGVALGCLFTFVHSVSAFVTPRVLGGGRVNVLATEIFDQATTLLNWPLAGVVSIIILIIFSIALGLYSKAIAKLSL